ncbi:Asp-tRNA(Asn)/Glu-tRNA(Gln) amidotransferase subunit GatB [soil metagenome]
MAEPFKIVIGLEVHVQLLTKTKMFCGCLNKFGLPPNSATCPVCLGLPGSLPVMNTQAFHLALKAALALNCQIANHPGQVKGFTKWDRKNYYYPDLPKNFQTSQYDLPFSHDGHLEINVHPDPKKGYTPKKVGIIRAHLEEDAGKNIHDESGRGGETRVDLNRVGTPLLEIVSHPEMYNPEEAIAYLEEVRLMMRELGVSDCEMQEGSLRCDANVNIHVPMASEAKGYAATPLVEIKNLNSFRSVGRAISYEAKRQYEEFQKNPAGYRIDKFLKTTAGWDDARGKSEVQRHKEEAADYRYFPEPDLVPVIVSEAQIQQVQSEMGELPSAQRLRLQTQYGLTMSDAEMFTAKGRKTVAYLEAVTAITKDGKAAANRISDLIFPALTERREEIEEFPMTPAAFAEFVSKTASVNKQDRTDTFKIVLEKGVSVEEAKTLAGIKEMDESALRAAAVVAIAANPRAVADYKAGKDAAKMAIVGHVMKNNKGAANDVVRRLVDEELAKG